MVVVTNDVTFENSSLSAQCKSKEKEKLNVGIGANSFVSRKLVYLS